MEKLNLSELVDLMKARNECAKEVEELTTTLAKKSELLAKYDTEHIPEALMSLGVNEIKLDNGAVIGYKKDYYAALPVEDQAKRDKAIEWLKSNGHASLIKTVVAVRIGQNALEKVNQELLERYLNEQEINFERKNDVHWATLRSWFKGEMEAGRTIPLELFQATIRNVATYTPPKQD
jgi:hypothetical protein